MAVHGRPWLAGRRAAAGLVLLAVGLGGPAGTGAGRLPGELDARDLLVTVGETTDREAVLWVRAPEPGPVAADVREAAGDGPARRLAATAEAATDHTAKIPLAGLRAGTAYRYAVRAGGQAVEGRFRTAPAPGAAAPVRFLWSGDLGGGGRCRSPSAGYPIFAPMAARRPDFFLFVGDTIYADHLCPVPENVPGADFRAWSLEGYRAKHRYNRADPALQAFFRSTSVYAIWDDHEVRNDFAGPTEPLMPVGRRAFLEYWPIRPPAEEPGRLYRRLRWGRWLEVFVLDTRQYRSPNAAPDGPGKTMLGAAQRTWLTDGLVASAARWRLVVSSVSLSIPTGRVARDGWANGSTAVDPVGSPTGFEHELLGLVRALGARGVRHVVWVVADVHRAEILRHAPRPGLVFHELVAGPLSAGFGRPGLLDDTLGPTRLFGEGGYPSFGEVTVAEAALTVRILDGAGRLRFETEIRAEP